MRINQHACPEWPQMNSSFLQEHHIGLNEAIRVTPLHYPRNEHGSFTVQHQIIRLKRESYFPFTPQVRRTKR